MGKKKKRSKFEKSIDHRNVGFTAVDALFEHNAQAAKNINRQITTKEGLHMYTEKELEQKGGEVIEYNYNNRYSFDDFKAMPYVNKREYIAHLRWKYDGLKMRDLAQMFGVSSQTIWHVMNSVHITFPRKGAKNTEGRKKFYAEMVNAELAIAPTIEPTEQIVTEQVEPDITEVACEKSVEIPTWDVKTVSVVCDAKFVSDVLSTFGFSGQVRIVAEQIAQ